MLLQAMLDCFLARCLPRATWLVLWDHLLLCPPEGGLLAALAVLRIRREQLLQASEEAADVRFEAESGLETIRNHGFPMIFFFKKKINF